MTRQQPPVEGPANPDWRERMRRSLGAVAGAAVRVATLGTITSVSGVEKRTAQQLADRLFPGQLTVVGSRTLFPVDSGARISFTIAGDPDAAVTLDVDSHPDTMEQRLRDAVAAGRAQATELRVLTSAFRAGGHPIVGVDQLDAYRGSASVWLNVPLSNDSVGRLTKELDGCVGSWLETRGTSDIPGSEANAVITLQLTDRPVPPAAAPSTYLRLTADRFTIALAAATRYSAMIVQVDGRPLPIVGQLRPQLSFADQQKFGASVEAAAAGWQRRSSSPRRGWAAICRSAPDCFRTRSIGSAVTSPFVMRSPSNCPAPTRGRSPSRSMCGPASPPTSP
ncbi:MAG: hypothetical protein ACR2P2_08645 [Nakamurella sp.]